MQFQTNDATDLDVKIKLQIPNHLKNDQTSKENLMRRIKTPANLKQLKEYIEDFKSKLGIELPIANIMYKDGQKSRVACDDEEGFELNIANARKAEQHRGITFIVTFQKVEGDVKRERKVHGRGFHGMVKGFMNQLCDKDEQKQIKKEWRQTMK